MVFKKSLKPSSPPKWAPCRGTFEKGPTPPSPGGNPAPGHPPPFPHGFPSFPRESKNPRIPSFFPFWNHFLGLGRGLSSSVRFPNLPSSPLGPPAPEPLAPPVSPPRPPGLFVGGFPLGCPPSPPRSPPPGPAAREARHRIPATPLARPPGPGETGNRARGPRPLSRRAPPVDLPPLLAPGIGFPLFGLPFAPARPGGPGPHAPPPMVASSLTVVP